MSLLTLPLPSLPGMKAATFIWSAHRRPSSVTAPLIVECPPTQPSSMQNFLALSSSSAAFTWS